MKKKTVLICLRVLLCILIALNAGVILSFSSQNAESSEQTSIKVTEGIAQTTVKDYASKPQVEKDRILQSLNGTVRKLAHMAEFASLGALVFALLLTFRINLWIRYGSSLGAVLLFAVIDECTQLGSVGRVAEFGDVIIDLAGAVISCTCILSVILLIRYFKHRKSKKGVPSA
ncbi:MAG: VanZ family protein [Clostridia bacterium]|nr:VanZ family protein [Clostridia bacterium]